MLKRTWENFVETAYRLYGKDAETLEDRMRSFGITEQHVLCYVNWTEGMRQEDIAVALNIGHRTVKRRIAELKQIWPHLFSFPDYPVRQYHPVRDDPYVIKDF